MNHYVKLICAACLSAMIFFSCSTHKEKEIEREIGFPVFESLSSSLSSSSSSSLSAVQSATNDESDDLLLAVNTVERERECSPVGSHSCSDCSSVGSQSYLECSPVGSHSCTECSSEHIEEYFNLPSPTVDTREYKTVCEGDNPPPWDGKHTSDEGDNKVNTPIQQFSITDEEIEMLKYIVEQETRGGSYRHKCIVTNVVLNRVKDSRFPNTVKEVLLQKNQFSSTWNYYRKKNKPDEKTENAVNDVLNGRVEDKSNGALYFHSMSNDGWFSSLSFIMEMEGHRFFK